MGVFEAVYEAVHRDSEVLVLFLKSRAAYVLHLFSNQPTDSHGFVLFP